MKRKAIALGVAMAAGTLGFVALGPGFGPDVLASAQPGTAGTPSLPEQTGTASATASGTQHRPPAILSAADLPVRPGDDTYTVPAQPADTSFSQVSWATADTATPSRGFFLKPADDEPVVAPDAHAAKALVLGAAGALIQAGPGDDLSLRTSKLDEQGNTFYKFTQTFRGVPVFGREVVVQTSAAGEVAAVTGEFQPALQVDTTPALDAPQAMEQALDALPNRVGEAKIVQSPELNVYVDGQDKAHLTWKATVEYTSSTEGYRVEEIFVDAHSGTLVERLPRIFSALQRDTYTLNRTCLNNWNMNSALPGRRVRPDSDTHARDAWTNSGYTYAFYNKLFDRDSLDGRGLPLISSVHALFAGPGGGCSGDNAMFTPDRNQMIYGDGGSYLSNPAGALDIVAHELTHGVTSFESNLIYQNESGAINEALSDIFAAGAEAYRLSGGTLTQAPGSLKTSQRVWHLAEDSVRKGQFMRNMADPAADGQSRDSYPSRYTGSQDNGGVHINSGIMNLAFYLLSEGGKHPRGRTQTQVSGIGISKALKIYYHANVNLFTSSTNFSGARMRLAQSAETLFGKCSAEWTAVHKSFDAVAVPGSWTPCSGGGNGGGSNGGGTGGGGDNGTPPSSGLKVTGARASSQYSSSWGPQNLHDGTTRAWASSTIYNTYNQQWVMLELDKSRTIHDLTFYWSGYNYAGQYDVWAWNGSQWQYVTGYDQYAPANVKLPVNVRTQYVLVTMRYGQYGRWYILKELEVE